jgi:hypothetical protein
MSVENVNAAASAAAGTPLPGAAPAAAPPAAKPVAAPTPEGKPAPVAAPTTETTQAPAADPLDLGDVEAAKTEEAPKDDAPLDPAKVAEEKAAADKKAADAKAKEGQTFEFKPPASLKMSEDDAKGWGSLFKDAGITSEQANKLAENLAKLRDDPKAQEAQKAALEQAANDSKKKQFAADTAALRELPTLGGANLGATVKAARNVLATTKGGPELATYLKERGMHASPAIITFLAGIAESRSDDTTSSRVGAGEPSAPKEKPLSEVERWNKVGQGSKKPTKK